MPCSFFIINIQMYAWMLMDVSGWVWQVISEFVEMYTCVHLNVYATMCGVAWLRENAYVFECAWMGDFTDLWMVPLRRVPCAFQSLQNCKWQLQEVSQQEVRKHKQETMSSPKNWRRSLLEVEICWEKSNIIWKVFMKVMPSDLIIKRMLRWHRV